MLRTRPPPCDLPGKKQPSSSCHYQFLPGLYHVTVGDVARYNPIPPMTCCRASKGSIVKMVWTHDRRSLNETWSVVASNEDEPFSIADVSHVLLLAYSSTQGALIPAVQQRSLLLHSGLSERSLNTKVSCVFPQEDRHRHELFCMALTDVQPVWDSAAVAPERSRPHRPSSPVSL